MALWDSLSDNAEQDDEPLDWTTLYYIGTVMLHMNEPVFWRCTLRKVHALFACHIRMQKGKRNNLHMR